MLSHWIAEAATEEAAHALWEGLRVLQAASAAHVNAAKALDRRAKDYICLLARERDLFEEERRGVKEERARVEADRALLERERLQCAAAQRSRAECPCSDLLAAAASMTRPPSPEDSACWSIRLPRTPRQPAPGQEQEEAGVWTLRGPVYRQNFSIPLEYAVTIGSHSYTVLPPRPVNDFRPGHDMVGQIVTVPEHWEVLSADVDAFNSLIRTLAAKGWGTLRLCVRDATSRGGFSNYSTVLRPFGVAGEKLMGDKQVLEEASGNGLPSFRFTSDLVSGRLVIRSVASLFADG